MKYILNKEYDGNILTSQCGKIFRKTEPTEVDSISFEVERYISQRYIIPFTKEIKEIQKKKENLEKEEDKITTKIDKPRGVSTQFSNQITKEQELARKQTEENKIKAIKEAEKKAKEQAEKKKLEQAEKVKSDDKLEKEDLDF